MIFWCWDQSLVWVFQNSSRTVKCFLSLRSFLSWSLKFRVIFPSLPQFLFSFSSSVFSHSLSFSLFLWLFLSLFSLPFLSLSLSDSLCISFLALVSWDVLWGLYCLRAWGPHLKRWILFLIHSQVLSLAYFLTWCRLPSESSYSFTGAPCFQSVPISLPLTDLPASLHWAALAALLAAGSRECVELPWLHARASHRSLHAWMTLLSILGFFFFLREKKNQAFSENLAKGGTVNYLESSR